MAPAHAFPGVAPRLRAPAPRRDETRRDRLVRALRRATTRPLTVVQAPAKYGKTTALAQ